VTERIDVGSDETPANLGSSVSGLSGDGDHVVFMTAANNIGVDSRLANQTYVRHRSAGTTELVSVALDGGAAPGGAGAAQQSMSADGRFVIFRSTASNLTDDPPAGGSGLAMFVRDLTTDTTTRVNVTSGVAPPALILPIGISDDGRFVLAAGLSLQPTVIDGFVIDRVKQRLSLAGAGPAQTNLPRGTTPEAISADGAYNVFSTSDPSLVGPNDRNDRSGVFLRSTVVPTISAAAPSTVDRGATVDVVLTGTYLFAGPFVSFGEGTTVTNVVAIDEEHARVTVQVAPDAEPGPRTILLQNQGTGAGPRSGGLTVLVDGVIVG
jgi:hypothetical protein